MTDKTFSSFAQFRAVVLWPYDMDLITFYEFYGRWSRERVVSSAAGALFESRGSGINILQFPGKASMLASLSAG